MKGHKRKFLLSLWISFTVILLITAFFTGNFAFDYFENTLIMQIIEGNKAVAQKFKEDIEELRDKDLNTDNILKTIQRKIEGFSLSETGFTCILDSTGKVIAHPVRDMIGMDVSQNKIYSLEMEKRYSLGELLKTKEEATGIFSTPQRIDIVANIPLSELGWRVSVHEIKEKVDKKVGYLRKVLILIGSIFYLAVVSISFPVIKRLISRYESELDKYACTLEQQVEERTKELNESQEQLLQAEKLSSLGELVAGVAHELNNPLFIIQGNAELLLMEKGLEVKFKSRLENIVEGVSRATKIVQNLLTFARKHKSEKSLVDINKLLNQTLALRDNEIKTNNIEVVKELEIPLPKTEANPNQLQQVFLNLINNAMDEMVMCQGRRTLTIRTKKEDRRIMVSFTDTGRGILSEKVGKIFDPFYTTKEVGRGTGLGLSISIGIVKEHGGNILVKSCEDKGTTFTVDLPILGGEEPLVEKSPAFDTISYTRKGSILVVDDEKMVLDFVKSALEKGGHGVEGVTEGCIAQEKLEKEPFDLILCDMRMPGLSGIDLYDWAKRDRPELARRFIFLTGDVVRAETREFLEGIDNLYVEKPVEIEGLLKTIDTALKNVEIRGNT